jgi:hypothetical protein
MTSTEADNLIATLPKPGALQIYREGDRIVMDGGKYGPHAISTGASSGERLLAHWRGYVETNGYSLGPGYTPAHPGVVTRERDYQPGDRVEFMDAVRARSGEAATKAGRPARSSQRWKQRDEVRRRA